MPMSDVPTATEPRGRRKPDWVAQFEGQMLVCGLLAKALYGAPDRDWLGGIVARRLFEEIPFGNALPEIETARDKLQGWTAAMSEGLSDEGFVAVRDDHRSEEHTSELQSLMRISYAVFCLKKKTKRDR